MLVRMQLLLLKINVIAENTLTVTNARFRVNTITGNIVIITTKGIISVSTVAVNVMLANYHPRCCDCIQ